jgi:hypothetical protein
MRVHTSSRSVWADDVQVELLAPGARPPAPLVLHDRSTQFGFPLYRNEIILCSSSITPPNNWTKKEWEVSQISLSEPAEGFWQRTWRHLSVIDEAMSSSGVASVNQVEPLNRRWTRLEEQVLKLSHGGTFVVSGSSKAIL